MAAGDYTWLDLMRSMRKAGFQYGHGLVNGFAVAAGENSLRDLTAVYVNTDGSRDRGPWQINSKWHAEVTDAEAFNLDQSCVEAYRISNQGTSFSAWSAYMNGRYRQFVDLGYATYALDNALANVKELDAQLADADVVLADTQARLDTAMQTVADEKAQVSALLAKITKAQADLA